MRGVVVAALVMVAGCAQPPQAAVDPNYSEGRGYFGRLAETGPQPQYPKPLTMSDRIRAAQPEMNVLMACLSANAVSFSRTSDPASEVAVAVFASCDRVLSAYAEEIAGTANGAVVYDRKELVKTALFPQIMETIIATRAHQTEQPHPVRGRPGTRT